MTGVVLLPYHQDERLPDDCIEVPARSGSSTVERDLPDGTRWERLVDLYDSLAHRVADAARADALTRVVTGDCLATLGTLAGLQRAGLDPAIVWFDAHGDVHTLASSRSGYLGGMALRMILGADARRLGRPLGLHPLPETRAVLVDARDLDPAEVDYLRTSEVRQVSVDEVDAALIPDGPLLVHVDVDVIDASQVPGLRFPVDGGPDLARVQAALAGLLSSGRVAALDIACPWHPVTDEEVARTRRDVLASLLDQRSG